MSHSIPFLTMAALFVLGGGALIAVSLKQPKPPVSTAPPKKQELREQAARAVEAKKLQIGGGVLIGFGVLLMFIF
ncbi:MAG: hypothetical protein RLZZ15_3732 [Verrucomicrobiota bacterium]